jgi:hypothetical protein
MQIDRPSAAETASNLVPERANTCNPTMGPQKAKTTGRNQGRYIYGVAASKRAVRLGPIGIEGCDVYTIPYEDFCAVVHNCPAEPYQSADEETVKRWVSAHQGVLDEAKERFGTVIPFGFDTILKPGDEVTSPDQVVKDWLKGDRKRLQAIIEKIEGRDEYGVQIFYEPSLIGRQIAEQNREIQGLRDEITTKSPGMAYMYKQKLEKAVKAEMERLADKWFQDFYIRIKKHTDDIAVEKTKKLDKGKVMLLNLSCLVAEEEVGSLGEELERINNLAGFSVHFSGPWPAYSFVTKPVVSASNEE